MCFDVRHFKIGPGRPELEICILIDYIVDHTEKKQEMELLGHVQSVQCPYLACMTSKISGKKISFPIIKILNIFRFLTKVQF